jgi:hypothetical protein
MADGFVNLQSELRAIKNDIERPFRALVRMMQRNRFFRDAARVLNQFQFLDQFVALILPLSSKRIRIGAFLNFVSGECVGGVARTCGILGLMNVAAFRRQEPLLLAIEVQIAFGQGNAGNGAEFGIDLQQQRDILFDRD